MKKNEKPRFELSTDETAQIRFLHEEESRVTRASLVSRDVTMKRVQKHYKVLLRAPGQGWDVQLPQQHKVKN